MPASSISSLDSHEARHVGKDDSLLFGGSTSSLDSLNRSSKFDGANQRTGPGDSVGQRQAGLAPAISSIARRPSFIDEEEQPIAGAASVHEAQKDPPVTWMSLPQKSQLAVLTLARLSEPLSERSLAAYMFYQLRWFNSEIPESTIASQGGLLTAAFAAAQFVTAVWWGRAADTPWIGRKRVLLVGLFGTCVSTIGVGFSTSFAQALFFRAMAGALNGNVGVMRTMISEIIKEKKYQSRAFLLLPMCFNIGVIIGPILGGFLADPIQSFPNIFGPGSAIGGKGGVGWMTSFPYSLPNLVSGIFILISALGVVLGLDETHEALRHKPDYGRKVGKFLANVITRRPRTYRYTQLSNQDDLSHADIALEEHHGISSIPTNAQDEVITPTKPLFRSIFTRNVMLTLTAHHLLALHVSTFNALLFLLLPYPISQNKHSHLPFLFTGGLGLSTEKVGLATAIIGLIGFPLQLIIYPSLNTSLGTLRSYKLFLPFSILAYSLLPFLALLPTSHPVWIWPCLTVVLALQVLARTFALPGTVILVNNSAPSPRTLGTIHGVAQSVSSGARTMGPVVGGWVLGWGLRSSVNCVGAVWWAMAAVAALNWAILWLIWEGDGNGGRSA